MTIKEEILEKLRKGTPIEVIKEEYRSVGPMYEALREYLPEIEKKVGDNQKKLEKLQESQQDASTDLEMTKRENEDLVKKNKKSAQAKEKLDKEITCKTEKLEDLKTDISELEERGFDSEIVKEIKSITDRSGPELLSHVRIAEQGMKIKENISQLKNSEATLKQNVKALREKEKKLKESVNTERNKFDELKSQTRTYKEDVAIVSAFRRDGYSSDVIKSLKHGLDVIGVKGDPDFSANRLLRGLTKVRSLTVLDEKIAEKTEELVRVKKAVANTKAEFKVDRQFAKPFKEAKSAGIQAIEDTAKRSVEIMEKTTSDFDTHVRRNMEKVSADLSEWGKLQQQKGWLEAALGPGILLAGIISGSSENLKQVPEWFILQLLEKIRYWCEIKIPNALIYPSQEIWLMEQNLLPYHNYKLSLVIQFVEEGLKKIMQQNRM